MEANLKPVNDMQKENSLKNNTLGAVTEMAVCKACGVTFMPQIGEWSGPDLWGVIPFDVKSSLTKNPRYMILTPQNSHVHWGYIMTIRDRSNVEILGWVPGKQAMHRNYFNDPFGHGRKAYCFPVQRLQDFSEMDYAFPEWAKGRLLGVKWLEGTTK